jgi:hypothetical protein
MKHSEFVVGKSFWCGGREWRCTDIGARTIVAICLDDLEYVLYSPGSPEIATTHMLTRREAVKRGCFKGPPYAEAENVFDEYAFGGCAPTLEDWNCEFNP